MKREILFRGKRIDNTEWVYGNLIIEYDGTYFINFWVSELIEPENNYYEMINKHFEVIKETVGQFTGKTKSTNHPMFDDKIKLWENDVFTVYGSSSKYKVTFENFEWIGVSNEGDDWGKYKYKLSALKKFDIIGNINDNPELLNKK